jgi:hypothetical protein
MHHVRGGHVVDSRKHRLQFPVDTDWIHFFCSFRERRDEYIFKYIVEIGGWILSSHMERGD